MDMLQSFVDKFLPKDQGKRELAIVAWLVVPLIVVGFAWAVYEGGFAEPIPPATPTASPTVVSTPAN
ncbi:MAG TPA: hypothetical protein VM450_07370 [Thermomicrobiales bacterium]|nr:hypothetical protein [Thermomicrobiales bacterium]